MNSYMCVVMVTRGVGGYELIYACCYGHKRGGGVMI